jgi:hypothetical protein
MCIATITAAMIPCFKMWMEEFLDSPEHLEELSSRVSAFSNSGALLCMFSMSVGKANILGL